MRIYPPEEASWYGLPRRGVVSEALSQRVVFGPTSPGGGVEGGWALKGRALMLKPESADCLSE
jgi:hypothetical protein